MRIYQRVPHNPGESDFVERLQRLLRAHDDSRADRLELEFTEGAVAALDTATPARLGRIHDLDATVATCAFGCGYCNTLHLTKIPVDSIRSDKGSARHVQPSDQSGFLLREITGLANGLGLRIGGEGVETSDAYDVLKLIRCA